jgi:hypothetical protein
MKNSSLCPMNVEKEKTNQGYKDVFMNATWCEESKANIYATVRLKDQEIKECIVDTAVNAMKGI